MSVLIDTSVYIESIKDAEVQNALEKIVNNMLVLSSEVIDDEIDEAADFLRKTNRKEEAEKLKEIYRKTIGGTIKLTERVIGLSESYSYEILSKLGRQKAKKMENDIRIVSSAAIAGLSKIITINRKTMAADKIVEIYELVNSSKKLKTPEFIKTKEELLKFALSL